jgi:hypothetical protein
MKKLYIASDNKVPVGVVAAENKDLAWAYYTGKDSTVVHIEEVDLNLSDYECLPVMVLLTSKITMDKNDSHVVRTRKWRRGG